jgi:hypothetical protein
MFTLFPRSTVLASLNVCLVLCLSLLPVAALASSTDALPTNAAFNRPTGQPDRENIAILDEVQNPDGSTTTTMRIFAVPGGLYTPNTKFWVSQDTYIASGNPNGNYGSGTNLGIGYSSSGPQAMRMLMQFNLSSIPSNATVNSAVVYLYQMSASGEANMAFQAQYAVTPWNEFNATWNNANHIGGAAVLVGNFSNTLGWLSFDCSNLIQSWVNGSEPNHGLILTGNEDPSANSSRWFYSSNAGSNRPYVDITYTILPTATIDPMPIWTNSSSFTVSWIGDTQGGPPITSYNFEVNVNSGGWQRLLSNTPQTSYQYSGSDGNTYQFRAQASNDNGASFGPWSAASATTIDTSPPSATMNPLSQFTTASSFWVSWSGSDSGSGVASYNLQYQVEQGTWQTLLSNTPQTSFYVPDAQTGQTWGFRVQAVDNAGNASAWPATAQTSTTIVAGPIALVQPFNPPILQSTSPVTQSFIVNWTGYTPPGTFLITYTVTYRYNGGPWLLWSTFPALQTSATFNWFDLGLPDEAIYQFQATASNNVNQPPYELPSQYWQTMIVDMQDRYVPPYSIAGRVTDTGGNAVPNVTVLAGSQSAVTNAGGYYTITDLITDTYAITPTKANYTFSPPSRTVSVPPAVVGQDFTAIHLFNPDQDSYSFMNAEGFATWDTFRSIFGPENVEYVVDGQTVHKALADKFFQDHYACDSVSYSSGKCKGRSGTGGNCLGMSTSSLALWKSWISFPSGITSTAQLSNPGRRSVIYPLNQVWQDTSVANLIVQDQGYWYGKEIEQSVMQSKARNLSSTLNLLTSNIDTGLGDPYVIAIEGVTGEQCFGHALVPYRYDQVGASTNVYVYDSNHPQSTAQVVTIDPSINFWSYNHNNLNGTWQSGQCDGNGSLYVVPASLWQSHPTPSWIVSDLIYLAVSDNAHLQIADTSGDILGYQDGKLVSNIPNAMPFIPLGVLSDTTPPGIEAYVVSGTVSITTSIVYSSAGPAELNIWGNSMNATVSGIAALSNMSDTVHFDLPGQSLQVTAGGSTTERAFSLDTDWGNSSREFTVSDFDLITGTLGRLSVSPSGEVITFTSGTSQTSYALQMIQAGPTVTGFLASGLAMMANDTDIVHFDWSRPSTATMQIDHESDGTVDQIIILHNTYWRVYLPSILRNQ